jgi:hypothetical protein
MADEITQDEQGRTFKNGVLQTSSSLDPNHPIHQMIAALASAFAPRSIPSRKPNTDAAIEGASANAPLGDAMGGP